MNSDKLKHMISKKSNGNQIVTLNLFQMFYFERLLERISKSKYSGQIILKGGLLLSSIIGSDERTTKDMDTTLKGIPLTKEMIEKIFIEILNIDLNDGVSFEIISIKDIRFEDEYGGFRINILSKLDNNKTYITVELTTGDVITPKEVKYSYNCIFENKKIPIMAYPIETVLAEKFQTIISRGILNTRLKDFFDIHVLMNTKINNKTLIKAIINTFNKRNTLFDINEFYIIINELEESKEMNKLWIEYQNKNRYAEDIKYIDTIKSIEKIIKLLENELITI